MSDTVKRAPHNFNAGHPFAAAGVGTGSTRIARFQRHRHVGTEISHRSKEFEAVIGEAEQDLRTLRHSRQLQSAVPARRGTCSLP
jgi:phosphoserine aminotransferase